MEILIVIGGIVLYYILGAIINGLMHRFDPYWFTNDATNVGFVVQTWIVIVPLYFFWLFCDRCIYFFEKKEE